MLKSRFLEKGYKPLILDKELQEVSLLDRQNILVPKVRNKEGTRKDLECSFLTTFLYHFWWVNKTIQKHL